LEQDFEELFFWRLGGVFEYSGRSMATVTVVMLMFPSIYVHECILMDAHNKSHWNAFQLNHCLALRARATDYIETAHFSQ